MIVIYLSLLFVVWVILTLWLRCAVSKPAPKPLDLDSLYDRDFPFKRRGDGDARHRGCTSCRMMGHTMHHCQTCGEHIDRVEGCKCSGIERSK